MDRFGRDADVVFAQHHWPVWGNARVLDFLGKQRDLYKYLHDQTVRLMNHGYKAAEIAERLTPAEEPRRPTWHVRGYYGTLSHNAKAVYQRYIGWYDANPANLNPLPPVERGRKYVEYMGGAEAAIGARPRGLREGRVPLRGRGHEPRRLRRPRRTRRPASSAPTRSSSSATRRSRRPGATPICSAPSSCGRACPAPSRARPSAPTSCGP